LLQAGAMLRSNSVENRARVSRWLWCIHSSFVLPTMRGRTQRTPTQPPSVWSGLEVSLFQSRIATRSGSSFEDGRPRTTHSAA
jgi:hypothetical protein